MATITINVSNEEGPSNVVDYVRLVAAQINEGYVSGHVDAETHWDSEDRCW
ncbi:Uncharacterised protein [Mycobacteroides abscessus subsp. bolletii]|uniref:hypothetical protein n=1 Tax=Mycobacteroides abscessus TaxID=36809 RepID=UPI0009CA4AD6|nr:hypothetical protein [Mycobacteroides abscessus]SKX79814.1 Uncharacterised protein [Mycobacteroides abscessus subsp. bolletii]